MIVFINAAVVSPPLFCSGQRKIVAVEGGRIAGVHDRLDPPECAQVIDARGLYLSPGFIDIHVHGGGGRGVMEGDPDGIAEMCTAHAMQGTTSIVPTTLASPVEDIVRAAQAVIAAKPRCPACNILGVHLEGPFLSPGQKGAQSEADFLKPACYDFCGLLDRLDGVLIMGAAPEIEGGLELGEELRRRGILASVAHSDATFDEIAEAAVHGYTDVTHIYSGCSTVVRRNAYRVAGVVEAGLCLDELTVQVIGDLKHLPVPLLRLIYKCKGASRISLISDGLEYAAAQLTEGTSYRQKNGVVTVYEDGVMKLPDRQSFAGSVATSSLLVRNMYRTAGFPLCDAVQMASLTPARCVGVSDRKGVVASGYDADLLLFDEDIGVRLVMTGGRLVRPLEYV